MLYYSYLQILVLNENYYQSLVHSVNSQVFTVRVSNSIQFCQAVWITQTTCLFFFDAKTVDACEIASYMSYWFIFNGYVQEAWEISGLNTQPAGTQIDTMPVKGTGGLVAYHPKAAWFMTQPVTFTSNWPYIILKIIWLK